MTSLTQSLQGAFIKDLKVCCASLQRGIRPTDEPDLAQQRYLAYMDDIQPGVRRYNVFWQPFESSGVLPSRQPLTCPSGYQLASCTQSLSTIQMPVIDHGMHCPAFADPAVAAQLNLALPWCERQRSE